MYILKIILLLTGLTFLFFGYMIYFKKKYKLINGFEADFKAGIKDETYAKRVGIIELVVGMIFIIIAILY